VQPLEAPARERFRVASPDRPSEPFERPQTACGSAKEAGLGGCQMLALALSRAWPHLSFNRTRTAILRAAGFRIGDRSWMMGPLTITGPGDPRDLFSIDADTLITGPLYVELSAEVRIGKRVRFGHHVSLLTLEQEIGGGWPGGGEASSIFIGDGVWLGSRVTLLGGSRIGPGSVVAAGAVVGGDMPPNTLVGGVPAKPIRDLDEEGPRSARRERAVLLEEPRAGEAGDVLSC
jgi:maltose O-acetyltransferase